MKIGVFDSGKGAHIVAAQLETHLPDIELVVVDDRANVPYGSRSNEEIIALTERTIAPLIGTCPIIVIACNTATAAAIDTLRERYPDTHFVGFEPMVKTAANISKTKRVTILATPSTLQSSRYQLLKSAHGATLHIDEPHLPDWATHIERGNHDALEFAGVVHSIEQDSDTIVLACTHYIDIKEHLARLFPQVNVIEPTSAVARRIQRLLVAL